jgi:hypothetical protein
MRAAALTKTYERVAGLPVDIAALELEQLELKVSSGFTRVTTVVRVSGGGEDGLGEDVTYAAAEHDSPPRPTLSRSWATFDDLSRHLDTVELFRRPPEHAAWRSYRRWAYESAALDLALRQAGLSLAAALRREPEPVSFVVSMRLGDQPSSEPVRRWLQLNPGLRFKLDPTREWTDALIAELAATGAVVSVDLKGAYRGTVVDNPADADLYRRVAEGFSGAWIEDPDLGDAAAARALEPHRGRITWDAPIHSVEDIEALPFPPRMLNIKPSRFGSVGSLFAAYDFCEREGIGTYGGGQFELGPGRGQIQYLASLFSPDAPNDVAPGGYNSGPARPGLPASPLAPAAAPLGFRWG